MINEIDMSGKEEAAQKYSYQIWNIKKKKVLIRYTNKIPHRYRLRPGKYLMNLVLTNELQAFLTCEMCSGTFMDHRIDPVIGFDVIWYVSPFSANLVSRCPGERE